MKIIVTGMVSVFWKLFCNFILGSGLILFRILLLFLVVRTKTLICIHI